MLFFASMRKPSVKYVFAAIWIGVGLCLLTATDARTAQHVAQQTTRPPEKQRDGTAADAGMASPSLDSALRLLRTRKYDEAVKQYTKLAAGGTNPGLAYAGLARAYLKLNDVDEASAAAAKAVEVAPTLDDAHVALGEVYFRQGKIADAEKEFIALIKMNTANPRAYLGEARVSAASSYFKQAKLMLDRARLLGSDDPDIRFASVGERNYQQEMAGLHKELMLDTQYLIERKKDPRVIVNGEPVDLTSDILNSTVPIDPCHVASETSSLQTNLVPIFQGPKDVRGFGLMVKVDGVSSKLELDTGSTGILIDRKIAEKANIKRLMGMGIGGIGDKGDANGYVGLAESIQIGDLEFQNCYVRVIEKNAAVGRDGLIGTDIFSDFLIDVDFPNQKFRLSELPHLPEGADPRFHNRFIAPETKTFSPAYIFGKDLAISTKVNGSAPKLFLLDTGGGLDSMSPIAAREFTHVSRDSTTTVYGLNGSVDKLFSGDEVTLQFANLSQKVRDIVAFDTEGISRSIGTEISGIIGFPTLRLLEMKIDYRDGLVQFNYDSNRVH